MSKARKPTMSLTECSGEWRYSIAWPNGGKATGSAGTFERALEDVRDLVRLLREMEAAERARRAADLSHSTAAKAIRRLLAGVSR